MNRILMFLGLSIFLISCSGYLDKPITDKLTDKELQSSLENDSIIYNIHNNILSVVRDTFNVSIELKNKYKSLTYKDYYDYNKFRNNAQYFDSIKNNIVKPKWNKEYGYVFNKIDSLYDSYYSNPINLEDYVKVELGKVDTEYYDYSGGIRGVDLGFRLTPKKGTIQQIVFKYTYKPKIGGKEYSHRCRTTKPFSRSVTRWWGVDYLEEKILGGETPYTIKRDYDFDIEILKIRYKNENLSNDEMDIPFEVRKRKEYIDKNNKVMVAAYEKNISETLLKLPYKSLDDYFSPIKDSIVVSNIGKLDVIKDFESLFFKMYMNKR